MLSECILEVNSDLHKIFEGVRANILRLNPIKSMVIPDDIYLVLVRHFFLMMISTRMYISHRIAWISYKDFASILHLCDIHTNLIFIHT
jgi:hypothetical protein